MKQRTKKFTGVDYAWGRIQSWRVWWEGDIIYFATTEEDAKERLELEYQRRVV